MLYEVITNIKTGNDCIGEVPETHWRTEDYYNQDPKAPDHVYAKMGGFLSPVQFNPMDYGILPNAVITSYSIHYTKLYDNSLRDA